MKKIIYILVLAASLASCGNNAEQQAASAQRQAAAQQKFADSIANATRASDAQAQAAKQAVDDAMQKQAANKVELQQSVEQMTQQLQQLQTAYEHATAQLAAARDNLRSTSEFKLLRTSSERQGQIAQAQLRVTQLQDGIATIKQQYAELTTKKKQAETQLSAM
jgi:chromosome segregation ATPase